MKKCSKCGETKKESEFYSSPGRSRNVTSFRGTLSSACKKCAKQRPFSEAKKEAQWERCLKKKYGITPREYHALLVEQNNTCAICGRHKSSRKEKLSVDHCHETKKIRGLLCSNCNTALGLLSDDIDILASAVSYLINSRVKAVG